MCILFITFAAAKTGKSCTASSLGKSCTASSLRILQGGNTAKVVGCSGAMQVACPPRLFSSAGQST